MSTEANDSDLEIVHVLFIDMVGYSKMLIDEQRESLEILNRVIRETVAFRAAEAAEKLVRLPSGDGMALAFLTRPDAPVLCAMQISQALKDHPAVKVRMGVHSGPVGTTRDVNDKIQVAGAGINMAQRVMDCGDAGHILLSRHIAEDLAEYRRWQPRIHKLGELEVKHGVVLSVYNFYSDEFGNPEVPAKLKQVVREKGKAVTTPQRLGRFGSKWTATALAALVAAAIVLGLLVYRSKRPAATGSTSALTARPVATVPGKSIAVLPFENLSSDKENAFFADGVQDEILTNLAKIAELKVTSRTSVMQYTSGTERNLREIGQALGVAHVLEGSVQRAANRVRVNAQLIDARTDTHLWAQTYDRDLADVFAIQSELAKAIADQLQAKLSAIEKAAIERPPTTDLAAFDLYSRAKAVTLEANFSTVAKDKFLLAIDLLNQAVARDPSFLLAWCALASAHDNFYFFGHDHTPERLALAETAVQTALRLAPDSGEGHLARAQHLYRGYLDYDRARAELAIAQRTLPNHPLIFELAGFIDRRQGRWEESARNLERAIELDPRNFFTLQQISLNYHSLRRYAEMAAVLDRALAIVPNDPDTKLVRAYVDFNWRADLRPLRAAMDAILAGKPDAAPDYADTLFLLALCERDLVAADRALAVATGNIVQRDAMLLSKEFGLGLVARVRGDAAAARAAFSKARAEQEEKVRAEPDYAPALCVLGLIDAGLGRKEDALREGRRAMELLPVARDAANGPYMIEFYAITCAWVGEKDLALQQLANAIKIPGTLSYGQLRLDPLWDPLRGDPRFDKTVESLAPKDKK